LKGEKIYTLAYADNIIILTEEKQKIRNLLGKLEKYLERKGLKLNTEKIKMMRFRKGREKRKKIDWIYKEKRLEEVKEFKKFKEFKNFGYYIQGNGRQEAQIKNKRKKAAVVMREIWGIGKEI